MESKIPLPTDNVYKFYALFGLLVILTAAIMSFIRHDYYNKIAFDSYIPIQTLKHQKDLSDDKKLELLTLEQKAKIARSDQDAEFTVYVISFFVGLGMTIFGFSWWHKEIQPQQDKLIDLQIRKLECEIAELNRSLESPHNEV
jgi:hypothetical protein